MKTNHPFVIFALLVACWQSLLAKADDAMPTAHLQDYNFSTVCHVLWWKNHLIDFSTQPVSALDIYQHGVEIQEPIDIWCWGQPAGRYVGSYISLLINSSSVNDPAGNLILANTDPQPHDMPFDLAKIALCAGKNGYEDLCSRQIGQPATINFDDDTTIMQQLMFYEDPTQDFCGSVSFTDKGYCPISANSYRLLTHLKIEPNTLISPGLYSNDLNVNLSGKFYGTFAGLVVIDLDESQILTVKAKITDDCHIFPIDNIDLGSAAFPQELAAAKIPLTVQCTLGTPYSVAFRGTNDIEQQHYLKSETGERIAYQLLDDKTQTPWDNQAKHTGTGLPETQNVDIVVSPTTPNVSKGQYNDEMDVTVSY